MVREDMESVGFSFWIIYTVLSGLGEVTAVLVMPPNQRLQLTWPSVEDFVGLLIDVIVIYWNLVLLRRPNR